MDRIECNSGTLLSDKLAFVVVARPKSAKEAWSFISDIVKDNKRSRTSALKTELRSITLGDLSMEAYFWKIDYIMTILASLDSPVNDEDVVHYDLAGLPSKYNQVCGYMHYQDKFPDLKAARSLLITEEMRLKTMDIALPADPSYPMALVADSGTCRFGERCRFVHDPNVINTPNNSVEINASNMDEILVKLLGRLGPCTPLTPPGFGPTPNYGPVQPQQIVNSPVATPNTMPAHQATSRPTTVTPGAMGPVAIPGQATTLLTAFTTGTLHDPATGAWNMDTGFHDPSGSAPM
ncbi:ribonuclease H-like domain-containing protein [Tanacetum coccineum]